MSVPIATSPGRSDFGPKLSVSYDSGAGNGPFGFGWTLALPAITRKTDKGLPRYLDAEDSDVFILSGAEDLVPVYRQDPDRTWVAGHPGFQRDAAGSWVRDSSGRLVVHEDERDGYRVRRYRPRIEGLFARIERWTKLDSPDEVHWRSISKDNVLSVYGLDASSQIADPLDASRIFSWLICETRDDRGNAVLYRYRPEDGLGVDLGKAHERNRGAPADPRRTANRYPKRIHYGNRTPLLDGAGRRPRFLDRGKIDRQIANAEWMFEVVFDYGDHDEAAPEPNDDQATDGAGALRFPWNLRPDPFSTYRPGFEVRTSRTCQRVLVFHHFPGEAGVGRDCLVRSTDFMYSDELDPADVRNPVYTFLRSLTQTGYRRNGTGYDERALPPVEFEYTEPVVQDAIESVDASSVENLPRGLDDGVYRWADLHGEGIPGILTEQAGAWYYKRNLSPLTANARFAPLETVALKPNATLNGEAELMDLAGDGQPDVVVMNGVTPGLYEHDEEEGWERFRAFGSRLHRNLGDPNVRLVDLDGDGHADVLITEDDALVWHASLAEEGFNPDRRTVLSPDEEKGPRVLFADGTESIYLADLSGDGLSDLARVRNGEVCYWPNLGYGHFGARVTMDNAPWFDNPDRFEHGRIRLADIDGSGTTDIIYLHHEGVRLYFNQSGNGWSRPHVLKLLPTVDDVVSIVPIDLLGNGTACLVWSSPLPGDVRRPMRYVNLIGRDKPHLLVKAVNNLGAETRVEYAPSTRFYLQDKRDGRPWVTRLPFPVHVVERVETYDHIGRSRFVTRYAYHHGYFDGEEREFRGFGLVEQWDTDQFAALSPDGAAPRADNVAAESHVPPVRTKTWFHTGARADPGEYFREPGLQSGLLLPDTVLPGGMTPIEEREAARALKGSLLRQEIYADDAVPGAGAAQLRRARVPYTVTEQNFGARMLQPRGANAHAVFFSHPREAITFHYERDPADPRTQHALTLEVDGYGNVLKEAVVGYGRRRRDASLPTDADRDKQSLIHITHTENRVTNAIADRADHHRTPLPVESRTYELRKPRQERSAVGVTRLHRFDDVARYVQQAADGNHDIPYEDIEFEQARMAAAGDAAEAGMYFRRLITHGRTLYRRDDLGGLLPLGELDPLALPGESYELAFTPGLLDEVFRRPRAGATPEDLLPDPRAVLGGQAGDRGGYLQSQALKADGRFPASDADDHWWAPSGRSFFSASPADSAAAELTRARQHFFLARRHRDPFGHDGFVDFDTPNDLLMVETRDALGNRVTVDENDYRVLQPRLLSDPNSNQTEVAFDVLGMVVGTAVMGKPAPAPVEGDSLTGFRADPTQVQIDGFFDAADPRSSAAALLRDATTRIVYDIDRFRRTRLANPSDPTQWQAPCVGTITRETHANDPLPPHGSRFQIGFTYCDGFGREIQRKIQAERARWVGSGWTIFNNKGKPVRQYEPFFSATHRFQFRVTAGVSSVLFYDPAERAVATLHPNYTYEKVVFGAWLQTTYDVNDTCAPRGSQTGDPRTDPDVRGYVAGYFASLPASPPAPAWRTWRAQRNDGGRGLDEERAAARAAAHADTPTSAHLDALGRPFLTLAGNRVVCPGHDLNGTEDSFATRVELDIASNAREVRDADTQGADPLGRIVMRYAYDALGNRISEQSMEAGTRWMLGDVGGNPLRTWDSRGHNISATYDALRRPVGRFVRGTSAESDPRTRNPPTGVGLLVDKIEYGEPPATGSPGAEQRTRRLNLRTRVYRHFDSAGVVTNARLSANGDPLEAYDFKGNLIRSTRRLATRYEAIPDWSQTQQPELDAERFEGATRYDALNRPIQSIAPHSDVARGSPPRERVDVIQPVFNEANLLERVDVWLQRVTEPSALLDPNAVAPSPVGVADIDYDAKGQRTRIDLRTQDGTVVRTTYTYDSETFRLTDLDTRRSVDPVTGSGGEVPGLQNLHYTYDPAGNITHIEDDAQQALFFRNQRVEPSNDYVYDAVYRLVQARGREHLGQASGGARRPPTAPGAFNAFHTGQEHPNVYKAMGRYVERYVYDAVGNFVEMQHRGSDPVHSGWRRAYDYDEPSLVEDGSGSAPLKTGNRLTSTTLGPTAPTAQPETYRHDAHGNMVRMPHLGGGAAGPNMRWDYGDRLRRADLGGGATAHYVYDASGQRVRKVWEKAPGRVEERIYLGGFEIFRRHPGPIGPDTATFERQTLHVMDEKQRIAVVETRTLDTAGDDLAPERLIRYQLSNHLGSACLELDDQAQIISYEEYAPYGSSTYQALGNKTETPKRYRYIGKERDEESGLYYYGARFYAAWSGRWVSADPAGPSDSLNLYLACQANPIRFVDLHGTQSGTPPRSDEVIHQTTQKPAVTGPDAGHTEGATSQQPLQPEPIKSPVAGYTGGPRDPGVITSERPPVRNDPPGGGEITFENDYIVSRNFGEQSSGDLEEGLTTAAEVRESESDPALRGQAWQYQLEISREYARRSYSTGNKTLALAMAAPPAIALGGRAISVMPSLAVTSVRGGIAPVGELGISGGAGTATQQLAPALATATLQAVAVAGTLAAVATAWLQPYNRGGGHHAPAKRLFRGDLKYNERHALAIPDKILDAMGGKVGGVHTIITRYQQALYMDLKKTGVKLTWDVVRNVETEALFHSGIPYSTARAIVNAAVRDLIKRGVTLPKYVTWGPP